MDNSFLPIGSVVMLKGGKKRVMVTGFCTMANDSDDAVYDYSGCLYPEGLLDSNEICLFNNDQIDEVFFRGFVDEEEEAFKKELSKTIDSSNDNVTISVTDDSTSMISNPTFSINDSIFN